MKIYMAAFAPALLLALSTVAHAQQGRATAEAWAHCVATSINLIAIINQMERSDTGAFASEQITANMVLARLSAMKGTVAPTISRGEVDSILERIIITKSVSMVERLEHVGVSKDSLKREGALLVFEAAECTDVFLN
jgi:hypothetical protein